MSPPPMRPFFVSFLFRFGVCECALRPPYYSYLIPLSLWLFALHCNELIHRDDDDDDAEIVAAPSAR